MLKVVAIVGPTAVGKTKLSIQMAKELNGEIISGDSMQVYNHLDIGTAKVTPLEMDGIVHHLINIKEYDQRFSVAEFKSLATDLIKDIHQRGKLPIIVGGTGFYLQALTENLTLGDDEFDGNSETVRQTLNQYLEKNGPKDLWNQLNEKDPEAAKEIEPNNSRRVIRALEVIEKTGHRFSKQVTNSAEFDFKLIGLNTDRKVLYDRINSRVDLMIKTGLLEEAKWLYQTGGVDSPAAKGIGYHELFDYFEDKISLDLAIENIKKDSRHYAKRQLTWFRNKMTVEWFDLVNNENTIEQVNSRVADWI
ncbi:tRNA delta(2)-isopentenylpyrophosphate transferase [Paucilactobacillus oligofermentans DSM 15707 = LMG 22743]|uniref:tRNA dimethylallyltransferase n=1 Tax=Paucilactobacillus oligofermentans DSM 15707 = LMG 22743 TaxID=1423778 RepID=A0A0R1RHS9_9LACO|nr:tRNA (adenosine(37)-N6)-dimethylallyltransferase MiaA [Paucilactobacillus oligofermentans]KRL55929.1 tRNA delta(2)-isopentenylpyrophosphate transferase [Paucilactobacillus oligofermentans DSM 15707 = LMG 22743]CUS26090.1 tRNA dimethylallyltransferase [Paucilactobacillus oligofermentans DSM 15707 = LMG 22743]